MNLLKYPDPRLKIVCDPVPASWFATNKLLDLEQQLWDTLREYSGLGLAAPQIGVPMQAMIVHCNGNSFPLYNPELIPLPKYGQFISQQEGCLSFPGLRINVKRYRRVKIKGLDAFGRPRTHGGRDMQAAAIQHEYEHLQGITLGDHAGWDWNTDEERTDEAVPA